MTPSDRIRKVLEEVERLDREATKGPWDMGAHPYRTSNGEGYNFSNGDWDVTPPLGESGPVAIASNEGDARMTSESRTLLPRLAKALEQAIDEIGYEVDALSRVADILEGK